MKGVFVHGLGAVSPAGWGVEALYAAVTDGAPIPIQDLPRPGWQKPLKVRAVPPPLRRMECFAHPRLRRVSPLTQHIAAAGLEALGVDEKETRDGRLRLGIIVCMLAGCVAYSRRFFEEALQNPATASPLLFPETVYNAPASHLAAYLGTTGRSYTLVGDEVCYLQALALAAGWLRDGQADGCLVIGGEELDWISADASRHFQREVVNGAGAGALYLRTSPGPQPIAELCAVTDACQRPPGRTLADAAVEMRRQLGCDPGLGMLCLSARGARLADRGEEAAWQNWKGPRLRPKVVLGEAFNAGAAWQCVLACESLRRQLATAAAVSVISARQEAIGARFGGGRGKGDGEEDRDQEQEQD